MTYSDSIIEISLVAIFTWAEAFSLSVGVSVGSSTEKSCSEERESFGKFVNDLSESDLSQSPILRKNDLLLNKPALALKKSKHSWQDRLCQYSQDTLFMCLGRKTTFRTKRGDDLDFFHGFMHFLPSPAWKWLVERLWLESFPFYWSLLFLPQKTRKDSSLTRTCDGLDPTLVGVARFDVCGINKNSTWVAHPPINQRLSTPYPPSM
jgi:hypothetical protein